MLDLTQIDVVKLKSLSTAMKYPKNAVIINEKDEMYNMYIILAGSVRVVKNYGEFKQVVVASLGVGDFFGEMSLFLQKPRTATVVTAEETIVLAINQENINEVIRLNPKMLFNILKTLCARIDELNDRVRTLAPVR